MRVWGTHNYIDVPTICPHSLDAIIWSHVWLLQRYSSVYLTHLCVSDVEHDVYSRQARAYKALNKMEKDKVLIAINV